jgi:hypothetical protein
MVKPLHKRHLLCVAVWFSKPVSRITARNLAARALPRKTELFTKPLHDAEPVVMTISAWPSVNTPNDEKMLAKKRERDRQLAADRLSRLVREPYLHGGMTRKRQPKGQKSDAAASPANRNS